MKKHRISVFVFHRDLRLDDNTGLLAALEESERVVPVFIFDPRQTDRTHNTYFSEASFQFLLTSLAELHGMLGKCGSSLQVFTGLPTQIISSLIEKDSIDAVYCNKDYTPFARLRDKEIADVCESRGVAFSRHDDACLSPIETIKTRGNAPYTIFTPFMRNARTHAVPMPRKNTYRNFFDGSLVTRPSTLADFSADTTGRDLILRGGRTEGLTILKKPDFLEGYATRRNRLDEPSGTSRLSAHHKFGTISIRETYHAARGHRASGEKFISELYWRDFYYYTAYHFPMVFKQSFLPWARNLKWINNEAQFGAWCEGKTGVPIVDAGMRQLNHTGYMHNRARMIVASYLTKNLLIDWKWGERYFASKLIDYDPAQNNGGWQWSASVGTDPRPLRIFNPYTQAAEYDPEAKYIHTWVPELRAVSAALLTNNKTHDFSTIAPPYPAPLVDQKESYHRAREAYADAKSIAKTRASRDD